MKQLVKHQWLFLASMLLITSSCQKAEYIPNDAISQQVSQEEISWYDILNSASSNKALPRPTAWVDCELYQSIVTPAVFNPANGFFDELYTGGAGFKDGTPLISESGPGDQDYNGGRWHANELKSSVSPTKYANACSVDDLDLADFDSTGNYFECPLQPRRGKKRF